MEEKISHERWRQIALAYFDYYVLEYFANKSYVINEVSGRLNERELKTFSSRIKHDPDKVHSAIATSCGRISQEDVRLIISEKEEELIIKDSIKLCLKENNCSLFMQRRKMGNIRMKINHVNPNLRVSLSEFIDFLKPLYIEAVEEILCT